MTDDKELLMKKLLDIRSSATHVTIPDDSPASRAQREAAIQGIERSMESIRASADRAIVLLAKLWVD